MQINTSAAAIRRLAPLRTAAAAHKILPDSPRRRRRHPCAPPRPCYSRPRSPSLLALTIQAQLALPTLHIRHGDCILLHQANMRAQPQPWRASAPARHPSASVPSPRQTARHAAHAPCGRKSARTAQSHNSNQQDHVNSCRAQMSRSGRQVLTSVMFGAAPRDNTAQGSCGRDRCRRQAHRKAAGAWLPRPRRRQSSGNCYQAYPVARSEADLDRWGARRQSPTSPRPPRPSPGPPQLTATGAEQNTASPPPLAVQGLQSGWAGREGGGTPPGVNAGGSSTCQNRRTGVSFSSTTVVTGKPQGGRKPTAVRKATKSTSAVWAAKSATGSAAATTLACPAGPLRRQVRVGVRRRAPHCCHGAHPLAVCPPWPQPPELPAGCHLPLVLRRRRRRRCCGSVQSSGGPRCPARCPPGRRAAHCYSARGAQRAQQPPPYARHCRCERWRWLGGVPQLAVPASQREAHRPRKARAGAARC